MLRRLALTDFRSYREGRWEFNERMTLFVGANGAGKSNLLEAIFFLGLLRSFRTNRLREMIRSGASGAVIEAEIETRGWRDGYRIEYDADGRRRLNIAGNPVGRASEFIRGIQPVIFAPEDRQLITGNAAGRRKFFDMLIALAEPEYWQALQDYHAGLLRRNAALRAGSEESVRAFEPGLAEAAVFVAALRRRYAELLTESVSRRLGDEAFELDYRPDYPEDVEGYAANFERFRRRERKSGFTLCGPQLDDYRIQFRGLSARSYASTGQGRRLAILLKLATAELLRRRENDRGGKLLLLVDDVTGDLDVRNRELFLEELRAADQLFFTFTAAPEEEYFRHAGVIRVGNEG